MSSALWLHGLQHAMLLGPSLAPRVCSSSCPLSQWCHPTISSSVIPFFSLPQSFSASGSFPIQQNLQGSWSLPLSTVYHIGDDSIGIAILRTLCVKSGMNKHAIMGILCLSFCLSLRARILSFGERRDRCSIGEVRASPCSLLIICSSVSKSCPTLCDNMDCSTPSFLVLHYLPEFAQAHVHWVGDAIQPSHPLSPPSPLALNLSHHQGLFQWVSSSHQVTKVLEPQLQQQSFQWIFRVDFF